MNILLIGGAGYIGSRLSRALEARGHAISVIDPRILGAEPGLPFPCEAYDVREWTPGKEPQGPHAKMRQPDVVIWLASIHDVGNDRESDWEAIAYELMVKLPLEWAAATQKAGGRFIYFSSTRAGTHTNRLYGRMKRRFEQLAMSHERPPTIIRPGTVWGSLDDSGALPNRVHTVVNRMLVQPDWRPEPLEESFFTCRYRTLEHVVVDLVEKPDHAWGSTIVPVTDTILPITGKLLAEEGRAPVSGQVWELEKKHSPHLTDLGEHPMRAYERYYLQGD